MDSLPHLIQLHWGRVKSVLREAIRNITEQHVVGKQHFFFFRGGGGFSGVWVCVSVEGEMCVCVRSHAGERGVFVRGDGCVCAFSLGCGRCVCVGGGDVCLCASGCHFTKV